jgi:hypothetical protein
MRREIRSRVRRGSMEEEEKANYKKVSKFAFPPPYRRTA